MEAATGFAFADYLREAVLDPLGMSATSLQGSPAHAMWSSVSDVARFAGELLAPRLLAAETAADATSVQFPDLAGIVPGRRALRSVPVGPRLRDPRREIAPLDGHALLPHHVWSLRWGRYLSVGGRAA